jgi:two-component system, NtrC family, response regulator AtoC
MTGPPDGSLDRLREELAQKADEVSILRQVSSRINTTLNLEQIQEIVLHTMHDLFGFSHALILLLDEAGGALRVSAGRGYPDLPLGARVEIGVGVIGIVAQRKKMMRVGNLSQHRAYADAIRGQMEAEGRSSPVSPIPRLPGLPDAESQVAIPLLIGERLIGVFFVESAERRVFSERDETLVAIVANLCASAIHNALLYRKEEQRREALEGTVETRTRELERTSRELRLVKELRAKEAHRYTFDDLVGASPVIQETREFLKKVARSPASTVLITGENGTGKDLAAKIVHSQSSRAAAPFMNITCSALAENLLESELFGHERGAFTGAHQQKKGLLELADGGTVFLDEIGEMSVGLQAKLLRFLEEKAFKRVGGPQDIRVDVRVLAATNRDLQKMVKAGTFREDLYYRLRVLPIELPPLRKRPGDVGELVRLFIRHFQAEFQKDVTDIDAAALRKLEAYPWPGNVRELRNAVERAVLLTEGSLLTVHDFRALALADEGAEGIHLPLAGLSFEQLERSLVLEALERSGWNQAHAAKLLRMPRDWLRYRITKFGLARSDT